MWGITLCIDVANISNREICKEFHYGVRESCLDSEEKKKVSGEKREMLSMSSITPASRGEP